MSLFPNGYVVCTRCCFLDVLFPALLALALFCPVALHPDQGAGTRHSFRSRSGPR